MDKIFKLFTTKVFFATIHMTFQRIFFAVVCTLLLSVSSAYSQQITFSPLERKVIEWTDARESPDSLIAYLRHSDEKVAWRAAIGLANLQDTNTREAIIRALREENRSSVQDAMAFALGCLGPNEAAGNTLLYQNNESPSIDKLEALGRVITEAQLPKTLSYLVEELKSRSALETLTQIALRNMPLAKALKEAAIESKFEDMMERFADHNQEETRWKAAYVFSRITDSTLNLEHIETIQALLNDQGEPLSRMFAAIALGRIHSLQTQNILTRAFRSEREWRVRVNILNALQRAVIFDSTLLAIVRGAVLSADPQDPTSEHIALSAWALLDDAIAKGKLSSRDSSELRSWLVSLDPSRELYPQMPNHVRSRALPVLARFGGGTDIQDFVLSMNAVRSRYVRENVIQAISIFDDTLGFAGMLASLTMVQPHDQLPYIQALGALWARAKTMPWFMQELEARKYANLYRRMLIRLPSLNEDPAAVTTVLELLQDSLVLNNETFRNEARTYLTQYLTRFESPGYSDQLMATIGAIKSLGITSDSIADAVIRIRDAAIERRDRALADSANAALSQLAPARFASLKLNYRPYKSEIDWALLESASDTVLFSTDKGLMYVKLDKYNTPLTTLNFIKLAKVSYFANNVFHRVVPNFVIQAGDRTQTGFGGPGYAIRREVAPVRFDAKGKMGMASSGKDTEGSQWFFTHLPTPHLDSRYTVFGEVIIGEEVIDNVLIYDKIENIFQMTR